MIVKISPKKGSSPAGLLMYLFGPGRGNEHRDMRVIAADGALGVLDGQHLDAARDRQEVLGLGRRLDYAQKMHRVDVPGGHVWHCSLALPAGEALTDQQWADVARGAVDAMGFTEASGKAPCRWVAVHHGPSTAGNDHIHIAVVLVRADGTRASIWNDRRTMSRFAARMEREHGLFVVEGRAGAGRPGLSRAELERAAETQTEPERVRLARAVRAHAAASADEAEFARRLRGDGQLLARARFAAGGRDVVTGYSVALAPAAGQAPLWFGGGRLGADLSLPKLRARWPEQAGAAEAWSGRGPTGREATALTAEGWPAATAEIERTTAAVTALGQMSSGTWAGAMREAAGVFAVLAVRLEPGGGDLTEIADLLAVLSQRRHGQPRAHRTKSVSGLRGVAMVCRQASRRGDADVVALIVAMVVCVRAIQRARLATEQSAAAQARLNELLAQIERRAAGTVALPYGEPTAPSLRSTRAAAARSTSPGAATAGPNTRPPMAPSRPPRRPGPGPGLGR